MGPSFQRGWRERVRASSMSTRRHDANKRQTAWRRPHRPPRTETSQARLGRLRSRDAEVIRLRYGLDDREHTLEEIGRQMGLTRERIRQIQWRAEDKLRTLLHEEECPSAPASGNVEPPSPASSKCLFSED